MSNTPSANSAVLFLSELDRLQLGVGPERNQKFFKGFQVNITTFIYRVDIQIVVFLGFCSSP